MACDAFVGELSEILHFGVMMQPEAFYWPLVDFW